MILALLGLLATEPALAHEITFSQVDLALTTTGTTVEVRLPLKALLQEEPSSLPPGTTEADLRAAPLSGPVRTALEHLLTTRLHLGPAGAGLPLTVEAVEPDGDEIRLAATAPPVTGDLEASSDLFPSDPLHKIFVDVTRDGVLAGQYALDLRQPGFTLVGPAQGRGEVIATFLREGVHHIFIGPDHILFVVALILLGGPLWSQAKIVTAFTLAHSVTLTLATLGLVALPSRLVESLIALSIVVVGLHDLRVLWGAKTGPIRAHARRDPRPAFAAAFGLVHGIGFASVLVALGLPREALAWSLAAFNVGVEAGQLAIVLLAAPLLLALRRFASPWVARGVLMAAASLVALMGGAWFVQRAFGA